MSTRVIALLEPVVGEGRVRVNVALKLNPKSRELTEERWDPNTVIRSRQTSADTSTLAAWHRRRRCRRPRQSAAHQCHSPAAGVAGAHRTAPARRARPRPPTTKSAAPRARTIEPPGDVARLSVAVILDDAQETKTGNDGKTVVTRVPRKPEELQKLQALVSAAVGDERDARRSGDRRERVVRRACRCRTEPPDVLDAMAVADSRRRRARSRCW